MAHRDRPRRQLRGPPVVERRRRILVVCEGEVTEKQYLEAFKAWKKNPAVDVDLVGPAGDPVTLVNRARDLKVAAERQAAAIDDDTLLYDEVWCCFDVDRFGPRVPAARDTARANGLRLAMSNPCFELWLILHLRDNPGAQDHHSMQDIFKALQPQLADKHIDFAALQPGYEQAVLRAKRLHDDAQAAGEGTRNPTDERQLPVPLGDNYQCRFLPP